MFVIGKVTQDGLEYVESFHKSKWADFYIRGLRIMEEYRQERHPAFKISFEKEIKFWHYKPLSPLYLLRAYQQTGMFPYQAPNPAPSGYYIPKSKLGMDFIPEPMKLKLYNEPPGKINWPYETIFGAMSRRNEYKIDNTT
jgi:hypothetical protein